MYRAISVAQRSGLTTMAFWHCKYTVILLNNANDYPEKMHKYVVEHILEIIKLLYFVGIIVKHHFAGVSGIFIATLSFRINAELYR